jgi:hypothetical protein
VEVHTVGGWVIALKVLAIASSAIQDQRQLFTRFFDLPVIAFRLEAGGIGLINPANITRVSAHPIPDALPETALRMKLLRSNPSRSRNPANVVALFSHENEN